MTVDGQTTSLEVVGVIGAGIMGAGIAYVMARSGVSVVLVEASVNQQEAALTSIAHMAARGRCDLGDLISLESSIDSLPLGCVLIIEAVPEQEALKRDVLSAAEARQPRLLATNTSSISIERLSTGLKHPAQFLGMHFFNPVPAMKLVEVIVGSATSDASLAAGLDLVTSLGKEAVVVRDSPGFATSRLGVLLGVEAIRMVAEGVASAADIDRAIELGYGHPMGPLRLTDVVGLDVRLAIARELASRLGERFAPPPLLEEMVEAGMLGKKSGRGFFEWRE